MQWRVPVLAGFLGVVAACGSRRAVAVDAATDGTFDSHGVDDAAAKSDATAACTRLEKAGQALLDYTDRLKLAPRVAFDGSDFVVVWHSQPAPVSSFSGELRFALVDSSGKTNKPDGISLGDSFGAAAPALVAAPKENAVVYTPTASVGPAFPLVRFDARGGTIQITSVGVPGEPYQLALAPHPSGYTVLTAYRGGSPEVLVVDHDGVVTSLAGLITAEVMASLWLAPRPGGFAAGLYSTNRNARLVLLDDGGTVVKETSVGQASPRSPSFAVAANGFAAAYASGREIEVEMYDAAGNAAGRRAVATTVVTLEDTGEIATAWTGRQLLVTFPGPVDGQFLVQVVDAEGAPGGDPTPVPGCLATASSVSAAWGNGLFAVATISAASGLPKSAVCVTLMACR